MSLPWLADSTLLWDTLILGGDVWPGLPTVDVQVSRSIDAQKKKGDDGANLVDQGYEPAKVKITLRLWLADQWSDLQRLLATIHPRRKGGVRTPLEIVHPATQLVGVRTIYVTAIGNPTPGTGADTGSMTISLDALEWFPEPKVAKSKPKPKGDPFGGAVPSAGEVKGPNQDGSAQSNSDLQF